MTTTARDALQEKRLPLQDFRWNELTYTTAPVTHNDASPILIDLGSPEITPNDVGLTTPVVAPGPTHITLYCAGYDSCKQQWQRKRGCAFNSSQVRDHLVGCIPCFEVCAKLDNGTGGADGKQTRKGALKQLTELSNSAFSDDKLKEKCAQLKVAISLFSLSGVVRQLGKNVQSKNVQSKITLYSVKNPGARANKLENSKFIVETLARLDIPVEVAQRPEFHRMLERVNSAGMNLYTDEERAALRNGDTSDLRLSGFYGATWMRSTGLDLVSLDNDARIQELIDAQASLVAAFDGFDSPQGVKIVNVSLILPRTGVEILLGSIALEVHETTLTGRDAFVRVLETLPERSLAKIRAIVSDNTSCAVEAVKLVLEDPRFAHCLPLGCFSHRIALFVGDIAERFKPVVADLNWLYGKVHNTPTAAAALEKALKQAGVPHRGFLQTCSTRWGSLAKVLHRYLELQVVFEGLLLTDCAAYSAEFKTAIGNPRSPDRERFIAIAMKMKHLVPFLNELVQPSSDAIFFMEGADARAAYAVPIIKAIAADVKNWIKQVDDEELDSEWFKYPTYTSQGQEECATYNGPSLKNWKPNHENWRGTSKATSALFDSKKNVTDSVMKTLQRRQGPKDRTRPAFIPFIDGIHELAYWFLAIVSPIKLLSGEHIVPNTDIALKETAKLKSAVFASATGNRSTSTEQAFGDMPLTARHDVMLATQEEIKVWSCSSQFIRAYGEQMTEWKEKAKGKRVSNVGFIEFQLVKLLPIVVNFWENQHPHLPKYCPALQQTALNVLSMVANSASAERCHACFKSILDSSRLRLKHENVSKLARLKFNNPDALYTRKRRRDNDLATRQRRAMESDVSTEYANDDVLILRRNGEELTDNGDEVLGNLDDDFQRPPSKRQRSTEAQPDEWNEFLANVQQSDDDDDDDDQ